MKSIKVYLPFLFGSDWYPEDKGKKIIENILLYLKWVAARIPPRPEGLFLSEIKELGEIGSE